MNTNWVFIALLAPLFWAIANYIDKIVINRYLVSSITGAGSLIVFTGMTGFLVAAVIALIHGDIFSISYSDALIIVTAGAMLVASFIPYLYALQKDDPSVVVPLYQLIPVFSYFLGFIFLQEELSFQQVIAGLIVIAGSIGISLDLKRGFSLKIRTLSLMCLASLGVAVNYLVFKMIALEGNFWTTGFWEYMGAGIFGLGLLIFYKPYRIEFITLIKKNRLIVPSMNVLGELLNLSAKLLMSFATLSAPLAVVTLINGLQPFIILVLGIILTLVFPKLIQEDITKKTLIQRSFSSVVMFLGIYLLFK